jgi:L-alanine-DL-glutamate epimerase-like enolase superfamily enzyme
MIVTVETDAGLTGIGEGGLKDTLEQCAASVIGENPFLIEHLWQKMYIDHFYPPGREKIHAIGAIDLALWDIKGKALGVPVHEMLGGTVRNFCECYPTGGANNGGRALPLKERAAKVIEAGYRCYRVDASIGPTGGPEIENDVFNTHQRVREVVAACKEIREGIGTKGDFGLDLHQKFDYPDTVRCCKMIEEYEPYFVEDPVRDEQFHQDIPRLRQMTTVPITAGEEWGQRWDFNTLVENHDLDYVRVTLPNVGGITEFLKILALCETHSVGSIPHFTGPLSTAALVNVLSTYSQPVLFEYNYGDRPIQHLP